MSLTKITPVKQSGPKETLLQDGTITGKIRIEYIIETDNYNDDTLIASSYLPWFLGAFYQFGDIQTAMYIQTMRDAEKLGNTTNNIDNGSVFRGWVEYTRRPRTELVNPPPPSENDPVTIDVSLSQRQESLDYDRFGNLVQNSVGEMFDKPVVAKVGEMKWQITRNEYINPVLKFIVYSPKYGCVNEYAIWGFPPRTLWLVICPKYSTGGGWSVTYSIEYNSETWDYTALDEGFHYLETTGGETVKAAILEDTIDRKPVKKPKRLDGAGNIAGDGEYYFHQYEKAVPLNFAFLNLPDISMIT